MYQFSQKSSLCIVDTCQIRFKAAQNNKSDILPILIGGLETKTCVYVQKQDRFIEKYTTKHLSNTLNKITLSKLP